MPARDPRPNRRAWRAGPEAPGTWIRARAEQPAETGRGTEIVRAVTCTGDVALLNVQGPGMTGVPGIAARVFQAINQPAGGSAQWREHRVVPDRSLSTDPAGRARVRCRPRGHGHRRRFGHPPADLVSSRGIDALTSVPSGSSLVDEIRLPNQVRPPDERIRDFPPLDQPVRRRCQRRNMIGVGEENGESPGRSPQ